jgi:asparagine synthase (glutamine-hydrolysing)
MTRALLSIYVKNVISELRKNLIESVRRNTATGLLFSGGLDSAVLAALNTRLKAITVNLEGKGEDVGYAKSVAGFLNIEHHRKTVNVDEAIDSIPQVIRTLRSFDPAIPNDIVVYFGLQTAKKLGIERVMTGDGSDEIFAGYSYMQEMENLENYIRRISLSMEFSSNILGKSMGIEIVQAYLNEEILKFSLDIPVRLKIRSENGSLYGKWILRKAFEKDLPPEIIWQSKRPLEYGSGMTALREIIASRVPDGEFAKAKKLSPVKFMSKEHFYYYKIYMQEIGEIPKPAKGEKACPGCGAGMDRNSSHCKVCGHVLGWET